MKRSTNRSVATRLRALLLTLGLVLTGVVGVAGPASASAPGNILPPFNTGETWYVYQGYGPNAYSHNNNPGNPPSLYGLDLTYGNSATASAGRTVRAPMAGTVYSYGADYGTLCVNTADGGSYTLTHINGSVTSGSVTAGQSVGTVAAAQPDPDVSPHNNGVAHIHFQTWSAPGCWANTDGGMPFDSAHGRQICGASDFTATGPSGGNGVWSGTPFTGESCGTTTSTTTPADFNIDGKSDIAWYNAASSGTINALVSTGTSFTTSGLATGFATPTWAGVGNFSRDDRGDIAWYQESNETLYLLKGNASGVWASGPVMTGLAKPAWAGVGDFNRDGLDDIAWYTSQNGGTITALVSTGTSFTASVITTGYAIPTWAGTGDFNGDGRDDIAWYQESNETLYLLKANNSGVWAGGPVVTGLTKPAWAGTGDFNKDGKTDIAWYRSSGGTITILVATATSFTSSPLVAGYAIPTWAGTGDYNGDGRDDIAWYQEGNHTLYLLKGNASGVWAAGPVMTGLAKPDWAGNGSPSIN